MTNPVRAAALLVAVALLSAQPASAGEGFGLGDPREVFSGEVAPPPVFEAPPSRPLLDSKSTWLTVGVLAVTPLLGYYAWWRDEPGDRFVFGHEKWFGPATYAGGADKASHVFAGWAAQHVLESAYRGVGRTGPQARLLSVSVASLAGVLVEAGDGFSQYGASWEDAAMNVVGAVASSQVSRFGLRDTVGMRIGFVPSSIPAPCCRYGGYGTDYAKQIYTLDLKLAGLLPRVGTKPGPARFILVSLAYGARGYRYSPAWARERNVGLELGLNIAEILRAAGVPDDRWWGSALLGVLSYVRLPYTSLGVYYEMNRSRWWAGVYGPGWDPGFIIYD